VPEPTTPLAERPWESVERMLDVDAALDLVLRAFRPLPALDLPLLEASGLVLAEDAVAHDNVPPFRNSAMDGFAVRCADIAGASWEHPVVLPVVAHVAAGDPFAPSLPARSAIRIMTGALLPPEADAVVRFEETSEGVGPVAASPDEVRVFRPTRLLDNVREAGEDIAIGADVAKAGTTLTPPLIGQLASVGRERVRVHRRPVVAILSTGDEVVAPEKPLETGKIRDSNAFVLAAAARQWGAQTSLLGIARDSVDDIEEKLRCARDADLIVTSGGVSLGDFDFVKDVLRAKGEIQVWQVRMKPGKPLAFGTVGGVPLIGVPGNPVAAAVSFTVFGRPAIRRMLGTHGVNPPLIRVRSGGPIDNRGFRRHYVRVRLDRSSGRLPVAHVVGDQGAGILSSLAAADALAIVPETVEAVAEGDELEAMLLDWASEL